MKNSALCVFLLLSFFAFSAYADAPACETSQKPYEQWFIGPVFIPNPRTPPPAHPAIILAAGAQDFYGHYDTHWKAKHSSPIWGVGPYLAFQAGFNKLLGIEFIGAASTNFSQGAHSTQLQDALLRLGFQITLDKKESWVPDLRLFIQEVFPLGKYQRLHPDKHGSDLTGQGSFKTGLYLSSQKVFYLSHGHKLRIRETIGYFWPASVAVKGFNYYGGNASTKGKVHPGKYFVADVCGEYSLSRKWAIALESHYLQGWKGHFTKKSGPNISVPSYVNILLTPEIQHTFSQNLGCLLGTSLSIAGKNSSEFLTVFLAVAYRF